MFIVISTDESEVSHDISCHTQLVDAQMQLEILNGEFPNLSIEDKETYNPDQIVI